MTATVTSVTPVAPHTLQEQMAQYAGNGKAKKSKPLPTPPPTPQKTYVDGVLAVQDDTVYVMFSLAELKGCLHPSSTGKCMTAYVRIQNTGTPAGTLFGGLNLNRKG